MFKILFIKVLVNRISNSDFQNTASYVKIGAMQTFSTLSTSLEIFFWGGGVF